MRSEARLSEITGRGVVYGNQTLEEAYVSRTGFGASKFELDGRVTSYGAIATGEFEMLSDTVERFAGRPPMTLRTFLESAR
ncbi:hypothetical protein [Oceanibacterium hippocampi]|uniref:Uncharacterized protein n=1 Tax=Oceanibacterium hippocampi TaxID=745714 RepID=A0A1Y5TYW0_9PROT|nr:hypothetical protein [Oceanibacterium hippocampi]SLN73934.1 hypothetical protein OCH7691_03681 [Oceanibacterium hippocampi]